MPFTLQHTSVAARNQPNLHASANVTLACRAQARDAHSTHTPMKGFNRLRCRASGAQAAGLLRRRCSLACSRPHHVVIGHTVRRPQCARTRPQPPHATRSPGALQAPIGVLKLAEHWLCKRCLFKVSTDVNTNTAHYRHVPLRMHITGSY